jgi:flagellar hook-associated protein FlgK
MISALNSAIAGLHAAETRVAVRATNIVNWQSQGYQPLVPVQTSQGAGPVVRVTRPTVSAGEFPLVDLATEMVDMTMAKHAYRASAHIIRTVDEMEKTLLDALA